MVADKRNVDQMLFVDVFLVHFNSITPSSIKYFGFGLQNFSIPCKFINYVKVLDICLCWTNCHRNLKMTQIVLVKTCLPHSNS